MQDARVRDLVRFAAERVPFYRRRWAEHGVNIGQIQGVADLPRLPLITKADVRAAGTDLLASDAGSLAHGHTSGTTGSPLSLMYDRPMVIANNVADWRQKQWGGVELGEWVAVFLGRVVVPVARQRPPFWRANHIQKQLWCSSFHLNERHLEHYVRTIRERGIRYLEGYPSTMFILAQYLLRRGQTLPMKGVFTSSETLHAAQRAAFESAFGGAVFDFYGMAERVVFAGECDRHGGKHLFDEYGVTEIVDDEGRPVEAGTSGTIVGTSLWNRGMPLIRYRTGDVSVRDRRTCACGRGLGHLADVATKAEDIVATPDGRMLSPSVLTHPFKPFHQLLKSQIIQDAPDHVLVKLVPGSDFGDAQRELLVAGLSERLGPSMRIDTVVVEDIPAERSGKFRWVICQVPHACSVDWAP
jgi:phenylacetate-CoA ligase